MDAKHAACGAHRAAHAHASVAATCLCVAAHCRAGRRRARCGCRHERALLFGLCANAAAGRRPLQRRRRVGAAERERTHSGQRRKRRRSRAQRCAWHTPWRRSNAKRQSLFVGRECGAARLFLRSSNMHTFSFVIFFLLFLNRTHTLILSHSHSLFFIY